MPFAVVFHGVHWSRGVQAFENSGPAGGRLWSSGGALPAFCPLVCIALCRVACKYGSISRFKGVLRGFWGVGVIFVWVWGFALIVGFLCACGVRRLYDLRRVCLYFVLFCPLLSSFLSSLMSFCSCVCLSFYLFAPAFFVCPLVLCLSSLSLWVVVSFSLTVYAQKERALRVWCVLSCPVVGLFRCH